MGSNTSKPADEISKIVVEDVTNTGQVQKQVQVEPIQNIESSKTDVVEGGCPMKRVDGTYSFDWGALLKPNFPHKPSGSKPLSKEQVLKLANETNDTGDGLKSNEGGGTGGCPIKRSNNSIEYDVYSRPILNPSNNMPLNPNQLPAATQSTPLSVERVTSSIPKGGGVDHGTKWTYPSPQMFFNALQRKGKLQDTSEEDMESVVALHNNMNEKTWKMVLEWERTILGSSEKQDCGSRLLRFQGRPTDLSPKAAIKHYILGHPLPYDRHDWVIQRQDGTTQRYVIDYYYDETRARDTPETALPSKDDFDATPSLLVDVRPAVDTPSVLWHRAITMPYAHRISNTTNFKPLPMQPTSAMKSSVQESVAVWQKIQQQSKGVSNDDNNETKPLSLEQFKELDELFSSMRKDCKAAQLALNNCDDDGDCSRASIDLTLCMGKILCPLQHQSLNRLLTMNTDDDHTGIETALTRISDCISDKTREYRNATDRYSQQRSNK